jgi:acyl-CoA thioesterase I
MFSTLSKSRTLTLVVLLVGLVLHLAGCNTVAGFGRDVEKLGDKIERKAEQSVIEGVGPRGWRVAGPKNMFRHAHRRGCLAWTFGLLALLYGCGREIPLPKLAPSNVIVAFGDSLTAGTGANAPGDAYPAVLGRLIGREVINGGVPGETSAEGLQRLPEVLAKHRPRLVLLCLGGNDTLQRLDPKQTADNLKAMARLAKERGAAVVLIGVPDRNLFGGVPDYYAEIATALDLPYEGEGMNEVLRDPALKSDHVHANSAGYRRIGERLAVLLKDAGAI